MKDANTVMLHWLSDGTTPILETLSEAYQEVFDANAFEINRLRAALQEIADFDDRGDADLDYIAVNAVVIAKIAIAIAKIALVREGEG